MKQDEGVGIVRGALLTVGLRWSDKFIGFVSTLILARLLTPADFGIVAMAALVVNLADVILNMGVNVALIQRLHPSQAHYDTAWTIRLLQCSFATSLVLLCAPVAAIYFKDPRVKSVLYVLAFSSLLVGMENIGVITFQKEMKFNKDFRFVFSKRISGFLVTTVAAFMLKSYWALIIGTIAGRICGVGFSYAMHPMRPRLSLEKFRDIFMVSQWMILRSSSQYLDENLHKIIVGRRTVPAIMGAYTLADEIAAMPTTDLLAPLNRVLFPAFVQVKNDLHELKRKFFLAQGVQAIVGIPAAVGLALIAKEAVHLLLGDKWIAAIPFIQILALMNIASSLMTSGNYLLLTLGRVRTVACYSWIQTGLFAIGVFLLIPNGGAESIAKLRLLITFAGLITFFWLLLSSMPGLRIKEIINNVVRPLIAVAVMAGSILSIDHISYLGMNAMLILKIIAGVCSYALTLLLIWVYEGCPEGPEAFLIKKMRLNGLLKNDLMARP